MMHWYNWKSIIVVISQSFWCNKWDLLIICGVDDHTNYLPICWFMLWWARLFLPCFSLSAFAMFFYGVVICVCCIVSCSHKWKKTKQNKNIDLYFIIVVLCKCRYAMGILVWGAPFGCIESSGQLPVAHVLKWGTKCGTRLRQAHVFWTMIKGENTRARDHASENHGTTVQSVGSNVCFRSICLTFCLTLRQMRQVLLK